MVIYDAVKEDREKTAATTPALLKPHGSTTKHDSSLVSYAVNLVPCQLNAVPASGFAFPYCDGMHRFTVKLHESKPSCSAGDRHSSVPSKTRLQLSIVCC
ncbi:hypothetical protein Tcan_07014 [Toxocara canis]|uniref:Uncharacterized protein n=1 Tax=Toxocara canis TaxID=6265 RepID=A0A0B2VYP7_TOXCA|nr:hypothetical protein Tcan_07014 [Toxocara canis]